MDQPTKVLIVSGDARVREPAAEVLLRGGFVVDQAPGVTAAIHAIRAHRPPDIVLVDAESIDDGLLRFLDELRVQVPNRTPGTVLLVGPETSRTLRRHPSVVYVLETPAAVRSLVALAEWLGDRDPHERPSLDLKPLSRATDVADRRQQWGC